VNTPAGLLAAATGALGGAPARNFDSNLADAVAMTFVGVRNTATGLWTFYAQGNTGNFGVVGNGLRLEHVFTTAPAAAAAGFAGQGMRTVVTI